MSVAQSWDVAARLAEGHTAVDDVTCYVTACHRLGYQHPDLTAHSAQVRDWYASEDGLDLRALDADCVVLSSLADAAEDAAREQAGLVAALSAAWSGTAAAAGNEFTSRTAESAHAVSGAIRVAADAAAGLRDALWSAVDAKVAAVQSIDGRQQAHRAEWLGAAETVITGGGDLAAASELVDQQVKPFVVDDVGSDWLTAMRTARASIDEAFDRALTTTAAGRPAVFDVPGELGPRPTAAETSAAVADTQMVAASGPGTAVGATPSAGWPAFASQPASWSAADPVGAPPPVAAAAPPAGTVPASLPAGTAPTPSLGELGGSASGLGGGAPGLGSGVSGLGGGLSGFGQQLADLIGSLTGSGDAGLADPADVDLTDEDAKDAEFDDGEEGEGEGGELNEGDEDEVGEPGPKDPPPDEAAELAAEPTACPVELDGAVGQPPQVATTVAPPADSPLTPPAVAESLESPSEPAEPTPCEIAADELPQVGE